MTFIKGQKKANQGGFHGLFNKVKLAEQRYEEKQQKEALKKMTPDERIKFQLEQELEETQLRFDVVDKQTGKCGENMGAVVDGLRELAQRYNLRVENGMIESYEVSSVQEAQFVRESFESLKRHSNLYTAEFNQILRERAGLADRILNLKLEIMQVQDRIDTAQMTVQ